MIALIILSSLSGLCLLLLIAFYVKRGIEAKKGIYNTTLMGLDDFEYGFISFISGMSLLVYLIILTTSYYTVKEEAREYEQFKVEAEYAFMIDIKLDRSSIYEDVIDWNLWLTEKKRRNKTFRDIFIPDEVEDLELIRLHEK